MHVETSRDGIKKQQKAFYFVDNLRENVLRNVYSVDLNYGMELKIQRRVHSGKLRITVQTQTMLKWEV